MVQIGANLIRRKVGSGETERLHWNWQWVRELNESEHIRKSELEELLSGVAQLETAADE
ncbi:hypothetical protein L195_g007923 [Trifolium pratense]|uniref:Uncharacterized protein n=1 Tax=Trifolium pratense TaxID=57577 RepID=A0A2K3P7R7_TRIPR|nr:hypothetical protein L195_g007923 [Trifolium pratense]